MRGILAFSQTTLIRAAEKKFGQTAVFFEHQKYHSGEQAILLPTLLQLNKKNLLFLEYDFMLPLDQQCQQHLFALYEIKRVGACDLTLVMPYIPYQRASSSVKPHVFLALLNDLFSNNFVTRIVTCDPHGDIQKIFTGIKVDVVMMGDFWSPVVKKIIKPTDTNCIVVAPDFGARHRAEQLANRLNLQWIQLYKQRSKNTIVYQPLTDDITGKSVIIVDDIIDTGNTALAAAACLKHAGAVDIFGLFTFGIFSTKSFFETKLFKQFFVTDLALPGSDHSKVISAASYLVDQL